MADEFKFSEKLSNATENKASILKNLEDKSAIPSDSVSPDNNKGDSVVTEFQKNTPYDFPEDDDLFEVSRAESAVDRFLSFDADLSSDGEEQPQVFSQDYEARKQKMLQTAFDWNESASRTKPKRRFRIPAAVAAALAVVIVAASLTGVNADAMPEFVRVLVMRVHSAFSSAIVEDDILYADNQTSDYPKEILTLYEPTVVLDGYKVSSTLSQSKWHTVYYTTEDRKEYIFQQLTLDSWLGYNIENIDYEVVEINGQYPGVTYIQNGQCVVQWQQNKYAFEIYGELERSELEMLAASVKPVEE